MASKKRKTKAKRGLRGSTEAHARLAEHGLQVARVNVDAAVAAAAAGRCRAAVRAASSALRDLGATNVNARFGGPDVDRAANAIPKMVRQVESALESCMCATRGTSGLRRRTRSRRS